MTNMKFKTSKWSKNWVYCLDSSKYWDAWYLEWYFIIVTVNYITLSPRLKPTIGQNLPLMGFPLICFVFQSIDAIVSKLFRIYK